MVLTKLCMINIPCLHAVCFNRKLGDDEDAPHLIVTLLMFPQM